MQPMNDRLLRRLDLSKAIEDEANDRQSLMPPAPGWQLLTDQTKSLSTWLEGQLRSGLATAPQQIVAARKFQHGVRPIPLMGAAERITYRALVDYILRNSPQLDRSPEAYKDFLTSPVLHAIENRKTPGLFTAGSARTKYVVKTDITAFYQYIDHSILANELLTQTGEHEAIEHLTSLLAETQGRRFGIPQLMVASDKLSEIYIDIVEREMIRRGWAIWRYNDDFLISVTSYTAALEAIESLDDVARSVGLTISESKTTTPKFVTYLWENFALKVDDAIPSALASLEPDVFVADYAEGGNSSGQAWAMELVNSCFGPEDPEGPEGSEDDTSRKIDLARVKGEDFRRLRRAFSILSRSDLADALPKVIRLASYVPALTPWLMRYVVHVGQNEPQQVALVLDLMQSSVSMGDWQRMWLIRSLGDLGFPSAYVDGAAREPSAWIKGILATRCSPIIHAEAVLALARIGQVEYLEVQYGLRDHPSALNGWYLSALRELHTAGLVSDNEYDAVRNSGGLQKAYLHKSN